MLQSVKIQSARKQFYTPTSISWNKHKHPNIGKLQLWFKAYKNMKKIKVEIT